MKRQRKQPVETMKGWTFAEAVKALPYVESILRSLRDHWLEFNRLRLKARRLDQAPGRRTRSELIAIQELQHEADQAQAQFLSTLEELHEFNVACVDPVQGEALFPFVHEEKLAWFAYYLFEGPGLRWWRYDSDHPDTLRPITMDIQGEVPVTMLA